MMEAYGFGMSGRGKGQLIYPVSIFGSCLLKEKCRVELKSMLILFPDMHEGAITSVQFHPTDSSKILTNGMDSCLKIVDIRTCTAACTFGHAEFQTSCSWSSSRFSPDGRHPQALLFPLCFRH